MCIPYNKVATSWSRHLKEPNMTVDVVSSLEPSLPEYELDDTHTLPAYSAQAGSTECLLQFEPARRTGCPACEWIFETKRMKVNLGRKAWKLNSPTYGLNATIDGSIQFPDLTHPLDSLHATVSPSLSICIISNSDIPSDRRPLTDGLSRTEGINGGWHFCLP